jgi:hypothetical protein
MANIDTHWQRFYDAESCFALDLTRPVYLYDFVDLQQRPARSRTKDFLDLQTLNDYFDAQAHYDYQCRVM